jgi:hypothetical protein
MIDRQIPLFASLCETCASMREVVSAKGSRFLLCQLSIKDSSFAKYPPQPIVRCTGYQPKSEREDEAAGQQEVGL